MFGDTVNVSATGSQLFLFASIAFIVGVVKYKPMIPSENVTEQTAEVDA